MMETLETKLAARDISFDAHDRRIMCFAHIINLCSKQAIDAASNDVDGRDGNSFPSDDTVSSIPIERARAAVRAIRGSGARRDAFDDVIVRGNAEGWFTREESSEIVQIKRLQLLRDVRTRWDSVYHMLERLHEMRPVRPYPHHCSIC